MLTSKIDFYYKNKKEITLASSVDTLDLFRITMINPKGKEQSALGGIC